MWEVLDLNFKAYAGKSFAGWTLGDGTAIYKAGQKVVFGDVVKEEGGVVYTTARSVIAQWTDTIKISYHPNGGTVTTSSGTKTYEATFSTAKDVPYTLYTAKQLHLTRSGCEFLGWALSPTAKEARYSDGETLFGGFSQDTMLYAVWEQKGFVGKITITGGLSNSSSVGYMGEELKANVTGDNYFELDHYQWYRDGVAIDGETGETYRPTSLKDDFETIITCDVWFKGADGNPYHSENSKFIYTDTQEKRIINNGQAEADYVYGLYDGMYVIRPSSSTKERVTLTTAGYPVTERGTYRFYVDAYATTPVATVDVFNWWTVGYNVSNISSAYFGTGYGTATMRRANMTLFSDITLWDEEGKTIILTSYSVAGYNNAWIVREGADINDTTLTIRPSTGSYLFCSFNGGEDLVSNTETTINLGQIMGPMMYDIRFSRTPPSVPVAPIDEEHFPDPAFRGLVQSRYDLDDDGILSDIEIDRVTNLSCSNYGIWSMKGIELFDKLTILYCQSNYLTELDLRGCTSLRQLYCSNNSLTSLDLSQCPNLTSLNCSTNSLRTLDLSMCPGLLTLTCSNNVFTSLDLHACSALTSLSCSGNVLSHLDVSVCEFLTSLDCSSNLLKTLDLRKNTHLQTLNCNGNVIRNINLVNNSELTTLHCSDNLLADIDIGNKPVLNRLGCSGNSLSHLDLSGCPNLRTLNCYENNLLQLKVAGCSMLVTLNCQNNMLSSLDVSACTELRQLYCSGNLLDSLDLSGYRSLTILSCDMNNLVQLQITDCDVLKSLRCEGNELPYLDLSGCTALLTLMENVEPYVERSIVIYNVGYLNSAFLSFDEKTIINRGSPIPSADFSLPASLTEIEPEAFAGGSFNNVRVPAGVEKIGSRAFADCPNLKYIDIQGLTTEIAPDAFYGTYGITICAPLNSSAAAFAKEHGIAFTATS